MAETTSRSCSYFNDQSQIVDLVVAHRAATGVDAYPTVWRIRLLLSSRVWEPASDSRVWETESSQLIGFTMLWRRRQTDAYLVLDRFIRPGHTTRELARAQLDWGIRRAGLIAAQESTTLTLYTNALDAVLYPDLQLESFGFTELPPDPRQHNVYFEWSCKQALPPGMPPEGYTIRQIRDAAELQDYQDLYDFAAVSSQHRQELFESAEYGHLVAVDREGQFQAYSEYSICRAEWDLSGRRVGWLDYIGTRPEQQRKGLGRAILLASLANLRDWGAEVVRLITVSSNLPAIGLYDAAGFARSATFEPAVFQLAIPA